VLPTVTCVMQVQDKADGNGADVSTEAPAHSQSPCEAL
jgi:hypothetical protein